MLFNISHKVILLEIIVLLVALTFVTLLPITEPFVKLLCDMMLLFSRKFVRLLFVLLTSLPVTLIFMLLKHVTFSKSVLLNVHAVTLFVTE